MVQCGYIWLLSNFDDKTCRLLVLGYEMSLSTQTCSPDCDIGGIIANVTFVFVFVSKDKVYITVIFII